jgi:hypothetical protein
MRNLKASPAAPPYAPGEGYASGEGRGDIGLRGAIWRRLSSGLLQVLALPIPGQKLVNALSGVILQAGQDVSEPGVGIEMI